MRSGHAEMMADDRLHEYRRKRDFAADRPVFVVQFHDAGILHFGFGLEIECVLKSRSRYGGTHRNLTTDRRGREVAGADTLRKGRISFWLKGSKLHGAHALTRIRGRIGNDEPWLLAKENHSRGTLHGTPDLRRGRSVRSGRTLKQTAAPHSTEREQR